jgi:hypothetical protein
VRVYQFRHPGTAEILTLHLGCFRFELEKCENFAMNFDVVIIVPPASGEISDPSSPSLAFAWPGDIGFSQIRASIWF